MAVIRCKNCYRIFGNFKKADGVIICNRCKTENNINLVDNNEYLTPDLKSKANNGTKQLQARFYRSN